MCIWSILGFILEYITRISIDTCIYYTKGGVNMLKPREKIITAINYIFDSIPVSNIKNFQSKATGLLKQKYNTFMTPGNYNTLLGVQRSINEHLKSNLRYLAYKPLHLSHQ